MSLFRVDESYSDMLNRLYRWKYPEKEVIEVTFQVTEACSLACTYCYQHNKTPKVMSLEVAKKYIDTIFKEYKDSHFAIILDFIGGEPLLQPDLIMDALDYWYYKCIMEDIDWGVLTRVSICSNGTEYFKPAVQRLMERLGNKVSFTVSIDGNEALHDSARIFPDGRGSYKYAIAAADNFETTHNTTLGSKMTIAPNNIMFLFPALKHYMDKGAEIIHANCIFEEGWTYDDAKLFYKELKRVADYKLEHYPDVYISLFEESFFEPMDESDDQNWCGGNGKMLACDPDGILYPCLRYMPSSIGNKQKALTCGDVGAGLDRSVGEELLKITRRSQSTDECFYCPIAKGCSWCSAYNYEVYGTVNKRATFICPMHKARALANVYYWNKYYRQNNIANRKKNHCPEEWALEIVDRDELIMLQNLTLED